MKRTLTVGGAGTSERAYSNETLDGCELGKLGDTQLKIVEEFVDEDVRKKR